MKSWFLLTLLAIWFVIYTNVRGEGHPSQVSEDCMNGCIKLPRDASLFNNVREGHLSQVFKDCMTDCIQLPRDASLLLTLFLWDSISTCRYECMWKDVDVRQQLQLPILQYYGKWPFIRIFYMQELASVLFSLFNLVMHIISWNYYRKIVPHHHPFKKWVKLYAYININTWIWSSVFHTRDLWMTEKLDYFSALITSTYSCFLALLRVLNLNRFIHQLLISIPFLIGTLVYIIYYTFHRFNYTLNMSIQVIISLIAIFLWCYTSYLHRQPYAKKMYLTFILLLISASFELGDFPPFFFLVDAHALWHLGTAIIIPLWYGFLIDDALYLLKSKT
jgi:hypothetical protein